MHAWIPDLYPARGPSLICPQAEGLIAFLDIVFDARLLRRFERPDGSLMQADMAIDDLLLRIGSGPAPSPLDETHLSLRVSDARATFDRALDAGAEAVQPPVPRKADSILRGGFRDGFGQTWWVASQV